MLQTHKLLHLIHTELFTSKEASPMSKKRKKKCCQHDWVLSVFFRCPKKTRKCHQIQELRTHGQPSLRHLQKTFFLCFKHIENGVKVFLLSAIFQRHPSKLFEVPQIALNQLSRNQRGENQGGYHDFHHLPHLMI